MSKGQRKVKSGVWFAVLLIAILVFALVSDWWKTHSAIGWTIIILLVAGIGFSLYRFRSFRNLFVNTAKKTGESIIFEKEVPQREPVPANIRKTIYDRAYNRCENPDCKAVIRPHLHHIDNNYNNNSPRNIIALCPNCHTSAHNDEFTNSQLRNWVQRSWESYKRANHTKLSRKSRI